MGLILDAGMRVFLRGLGNVLDIIKMVYFLCSFKIGDYSGNLLITKLIVHWEKVLVQGSVTFFGLTHVRYLLNNKSSGCTYF